MAFAGPDVPRVIARLPLVPGANARVNVDLCATDEDVAWFEVISWGTVRWRVFHGPTPLDVVRS